MNNKNINADYHDHFYYLALNHFQKIGPINTKRLEKFFPNIRQAYFANYENLKRAGLRESLICDFISWRDSPAANIENMMARLEEEKISFVTWHDENYPTLLKEISDPPPLLYYKGRLNGETPNGEAKNRLAVVGSRCHSTYAERIIEELLPVVIKARIEIVSGLALGIDTLAHQAALDSDGVTLAILGTGLSDDNIYPPDNRRLAEKIINSGGAIISDFPPGTPPYKQNFPQRNRIISGLAQATLVIEAKTKSGALITAAQALDQNREILAIPGNIFSEFSSGPNELIKSGAKTITRPEDILEIFRLEMKQGPKIDKKILKKNAASDFCPPLNGPDEITIYNLIKGATERAERITTDEIIKITKLDTMTVNSTLSILEIRGMIKNIGLSYELD